MFIQNPLQTYSFAFPVLEAVHIAAIILGVGTAALVNLRLLGVGPAQSTAAELWKDSRPWTLIGLTLAIFSGLLLFSIDPASYYYNSVFRLKMTALVLAILFYYTMVRRAAHQGGGRTVALISLVLWSLVPFGGIFIGFVESTPPLANV